MTEEPTHVHLADSLAELHTDVRGLRGEIREDMREHRKEITAISRRVNSVEKSRDWQTRRDKLFGTAAVIVAGVWAKVWEFLP